MLLIDDNETELRPGQEQGRARAHDDLRVAFGNRAPHSFAFARPHGGMPLRRLDAEAPFDPLDELLGERDLGQEQQHLAA